jgi:hypothetical protein
MLVMVGAARLPGIDQQTSTNSLVTLLSATPVMRVIARIDDPSQSIDWIWTRCDRELVHAGHDSCPCLSGQE